MLVIKFSFFQIFNFIVLHFRMTFIRDMVSEMSVANESGIYAFGHSPGLATLGTRGPLFTAAIVSDRPTKDKPEVLRPAAPDYPHLQIENVHKSLREMEKHVCTRIFAFIRFIFK